MSLYIILKINESPMKKNLSLCFTWLRTHSNFSLKIKRKSKRISIKQCAPYFDASHSAADKVVRTKWDWNNKHTALLILMSCLSNVAYALLPIEHWTTSAGTRVYLVTTHTVPMLDIRIDFDAGARFDPINKSGLANLTVDLLNTGVEANAQQPALDEGEIADSFADLGAIYADDIDMDRSTLRLRTLSAPEQLNRALDILNALLQRPAFPDAVIQRKLEINKSSLREALTKAPVIAQRQFLSAVYGSHPYGQLTTEASLANLTRTDVLNFYQERYGANRATIILVGDVTTNQAKALAERLSQSLPKHSDQKKFPPVISLSGKGQEFHLPHPAEQAHIFIGQPGVARNDPDYFALTVGNYILGGGGFVSRLMREVREKRGLTYNINSSFLFNLQPGIFQINLQTRKDQTEQALHVIQQTLTKFIQDGATAKELAEAKNNLIRGFPLYIDNNEKWLSIVANIAWYQLPFDYLSTWTERINSVTLTDIKAAFQKHLQPQSMVTVVVGQ